MIEINLLPGAHKAKRSAAASVDFKAQFAALGARITDRWLVGAVGAWAVALLIVGLLFWRERSRRAELTELEAQAVADSARLSSVLAERIGAEARRDSALRQLNIIRAIDGDRFLWPHVMEEVSAALPPYTWLTQLAYTGAAVAPPAALPKDTTPSKPDTGAMAAARARRRKRLNTDVTPDTVRVAIIGSTVDIQALTRFMKDLEASPFLSRVDLKKSTVVVEQNREVTNFELEAMFERPDSTVVRRVPLRLSGGR